MTPDELKRAQRALTTRGYDVGVIDGLFGPKTLHGLLAFVSGSRLSEALKAHADALAPQLIKGGLVRPLRLAHFLANASVETMGFTRLVESMAWKDAARLDAVYSRVKGQADAVALIRRGPEAIANRVYAGVNGNGNEASGDGWKYLGRGYLHHTGKGNHAALVKWTGLPLVEKPALLEVPGYAAIAAVAYWENERLNAAADRNDADKIRRIINGPAKLELSTTRARAARIVGLF